MTVYVSIEKHEGGYLVHLPSSDVITTSLQKAMAMMKAALVEDSIPDEVDNHG